MWIRTQNRERLIDVKNVAVSLSKIDGKYLVFTNDDSIDDYLFTLATYPTKERCLEVLDEIERHILNYTVKNTAYVPVVYQMPKE